MRLTIIGAGNMGGAIARALADGPYFNVSDITCTARSSETLSNLGRDFNTSTDNHEAVKSADIVVFAVKPWLMEAVVREVASGMDLSRQIIMSVAAGITFNGTVAQFVVVNDYLDAIVDINKNPEGVESNIVGENNMVEKDCKIALYKLKAKMKKKELEER